MAGGRGWPFPLILNLLQDCRLTVDAWDGGPVVIAERPR